MGGQGVAADWTAHASAAPCGALAPRWFWRGTGPPAAAEPRRSAPDACPALRCPACSEGTRVGWSDELLGFDCGGQQWVLEVAFPAGTVEQPDGRWAERAAAGPAPRPCADILGWPLPQRLERCLALLHLMRLVQTPRQFTTRGGAARSFVPCLALLCPPAPAPLTRLCCLPARPPAGTLPTWRTCCGW